MNASDIKKVFVAGGGLMGRQIALEAAIKGYDAWVYDSQPGVNEAVDKWAQDYLKGRIEKGKMTQEAVDATKAKFHIATSLEEGAKDADLVIEAIIEIQEEKEKFFKQLDAIVREDTIITTNSSFMVSSLFVGCVSNPSRLANLHYFNPALVMKLVEIVKGEHTSDETAQTLYDFVKSLDKVPVIIQKEVDGFLVNRISRAISSAALEIVEMGVATPEDVDLALVNGLNHPLGPFRLMDLTGIDLSYHILETRKANGENPPGYELVKAKYEAGEYGRKTKKGWYTYD
ncbi:3-hydroxyacyl-CoA dehydrogenase family protein [Ruminococcaceae bacterium OttesenSCG-928-O06]|nr:3-hydroxyacyl-CoA dehydrogenase family protein [Ruminococcaceae bacterium OttesenSCG-928-O06]